MTKKEKALKVVGALKKRYPDAQCSLDGEDPFHLLVAVRLSAQCTDARVNLVTPALFERYPDAASMAAATPEEVEPYIRSCGLFHTKAKDLVAMATMLCREYGGKVPSSLEELLKLPGVGRKTANLICGDVFGMPGAVVADTHCIRISNRLGFCDTKDPTQVERELRKCLPPEESNDFCHRLVHFGRDVCIARRPRCEECELREYCRHVKTV